MYLISRRSSPPPPPKKKKKGKVGSDDPTLILYLRPTRIEIQRREKFETKTGTIPPGATTLCEFRIHNENSLRYVAWQRREKMHFELHVYQVINIRKHFVGKQVKMVLEHHEWKLKVRALYAKWLLDTKVRLSMPLLLVT